jgi:hypothetical protein
VVEYQKPKSRSGVCGAESLRNSHRNSHRAAIGKAPSPGNPMRRFQLPLLGSNQDSPDPESSGRGNLSGQLVGNRPLPEHRCPLPCRSLPGSARRNYGKTTAWNLSQASGSSGVWIDLHVCHTETPAASMVDRSVEH